VKREEQSAPEEVTEKAGKEKSAQINKKYFLLGDIYTVCHNLHYQPEISF